jgi:protein TonB
MNRPLVAFEQFEPVITDRKRADVVPINQDIGRLLENLSAASSDSALGSFRHSTDYRDSKAIDYLLLIVLSVLVHTTLVEHFKHASVQKEELVEPVKPPTKVQITLARPQPPKPAVVQPPPPPKVVAINKPPKPKVQPKPAPKVEPPPVTTPTAVQTDAPVVSAPPAPPAPVEEKVTEPRAGAGYLNNPAPIYPEVAMDMGWEGKVLMKVHVLASGKPDNVSVIKSSGREVLDDEAVRTVKQWTFVPAMRGTTPIDGWVTVPISFNLQG